MRTDELSARDVIIDADGEDSSAKRCSSPPWLYQLISLKNQRTTNNKRCHTSITPPSAIIVGDLYLGLLSLYASHLRESFFFFFLRLHET